MTGNKRSRLAILPMVLSGCLSVGWSKRRGSSRLPVVLRRTGGKPMARRLAFCLSVAASLCVLPSAHAGHSSLSCNDCHMTHRAPGGEDAGSGALWSTMNIDDGLPVFTLYSSPSFDALRTDIDQPDGPSKLCLGCHDGSYEGFISGSSMTFDAGDLSKSHPISFTYDSALAARVQRGRLNDPSSTPSGLGRSIAEDLLDDAGKMQCTSCHDVHSTRGIASDLRYAYDEKNPRLCKVCHNL